MSSTRTKIEAAEAYAKARRNLLEACGIPDSCRDPLNEFGEVLVADLLNGSLADSRVEPGFDLTTPDGRKVQVKTLSNPRGSTWRNEITMVFNELVDDFALVIFTDLQFESVLVFPKETLPAICVMLGKRHGNTHATIQLTKRNCEAILADPKRFENVGGQIIRKDQLTD